MTLRTSTSCARCSRRWISSSTPRPTARAGSRSPRSIKPDLAMVDVSMPGMTGWQVAERLRAMPGLETLKIVIVSANAHEFSPGGAGATHDAFLIKPIDMQRMLECLAAQLNLRVGVRRRRPPRVWRARPICRARCPNTRATTSTISINSASSATCAASRPSFARWKPTPPTNRSRPACARWSRISISNAT